MTKCGLVAQACFYLGVLLMALVVLEFAGPYVGQWIAGWLD